MLYVGSLFSGIGGIELGFERAGGFEVRWFVENDNYAQAVLRKRWPDTPVHGDITRLNIAGLPRIDILTGGFPCQDISNAGKRAGIEGSRSGLWHYYREAISELRPKIAVVENVSALTFRGLREVLGDLAEVGYDAEWHCVPASAVGAPHQRDRVFIIAFRADIMAYPNKRGCKRSFGLAQDGRRQKAGGGSEPVRAGEDVADPDIEGSGQGSGERNINHHRENNSSKRNGRPDVESISNTKGRRPVESGLGGVADGVPSWLDKHTWMEEPEGIPRVTKGQENRVNRIKCLGNAVVPQVAEAFAEAINQTIKQRGGVSARSGTGGTMKKKTSPTEINYETLSFGDVPEPPDELREPPVFPGKVRNTDLARPKERVKRRVSGFFAKFRKRQRFLVEMHYANGSVQYFIVSYLDRRFMLKGRVYVIDEDVKEWCVNLRLFKLVYHEDFTLPYRSDVSADELMGGVGEGNRDIRTSFSPSVLRDVLKFEYVKGVIRGAEVSQLVKRIFIAVIVVLLAVLAHLFINAYKSGWI